MREAEFVAEVERVAGASVTGATAPDRLGQVAPPDVESLSAVLRLCTAHGQPVWPIGAGTWMSVPATPRAMSTRPALDVSTSALAGVLEHVPADLVIGVQAGTSLAALHQHLADAGQRLPLDPPAADGATIGATIALGCAGPLRAGHGLPRDMALGLEVVTGDGRVLRYGGRVVKNVAGYDGVRLFTGSAGALGIITAIYLRVRGLPRADRTWWVPVSVDRALELALAMRAAVEPDALELISPTLAAHVGLDAAWTVVVRLSGGEDAVEAAGSRVADTAARAGLAARLSDPIDGDVVTSSIGAGQGAPGTLWDRLAACETVASRHISLPAGVTRTAATLAQLDRNMASDNDEARHWHVAVHITDGTIRVWADPVVRAPTGTSAAPAWLGAMTESLHQNGQLSGSRIAAAAVSARLAAAFDPAGVLVPGRHLRAGM